jgi:hypothetical protein
MRNTIALRLTIGAVPLALLVACTHGGEREASSQPEPVAEAPAPGVGAEDQTPTPSASVEEDTLRNAVQGYSDAFLGGEPVQAYEYFSSRCEERTSLSYFTGIVTAAEGLYGAALPIRDYSAEISGDLARVTYTYDVPALDQTREPWSRESGAWKLDDC